MIHVTAALIERDGKMLIAQRRRGEYLELKWELPGGKVEDGETPEECLRREMAEEFMVNVEVGDFMGSIIHSYSDLTVCLMAYRVELLSEVSVMNNHEKVLWVNVSELGSYDLAPADRVLLNQLYGV